MLEFGSHLKTKIIYQNQWILFFSFYEKLLKYLIN